MIVGSGEGSIVVRSSPEEDHEAQLTRDDVTASVHYVRFRLGSDQIARFAAEPVVLAVNHPAYAEGARLTEDTKATLLHDLHGR